MRVKTNDVSKCLYMTNKLLLSKVHEIQVLFSTILCFCDGSVDLSRHSAFRTQWTICAMAAAIS